VKHFNNVEFAKKKFHQVTLNSEANQSVRRRKTKRVGRVMQRHPVVKKMAKLFHFVIIKRPCGKKMAKFWFNL
jgi:hypothetical protein